MGVVSTSDTCEKPSMTQKAFFTWRREVLTATVMNQKKPVNEPLAPCAPVQRQTPTTMQTVDKTIPHLRPLRSHKSPMMTCEGVPRPSVGFGELDKMERESQATVTHLPENCTDREGVANTSGCSRVVCFAVELSKDDVGDCERA